MNTLAGGVGIAESANNMYDSRIENLNIQNWPVHCFDIEHTENMIISGITLDISTGDAPRSASGSKPAAQPTASISPLAPTSPVEQLGTQPGRLRRGLKRQPRRRRLHLRRPWAKHRLHRQQERQHRRRGDLQLAGHR